MKDDRYICEGLTWSACPVISVSEGLITAFAFIRLRYIKYRYDTTTSSVHLKNRRNVMNENTFGCRPKRDYHI